MAAKPWGRELTAGLVAGAGLAPAQQRQHRDHPGRIPHLHRALPRAGLRRQHDRRPALCRRGATGEGPARRAGRALRAGRQCPCLAGGPRRSDRRGAEERRAVEQGSRRGGGRLRHRQPLCAGLAARPRTADAGRAGRRPSPASRCSCRAGRWLGTRCLDISKVATVLDAPPKVESCLTRRDRPLFRHEKGPSLRSG